MVHPIVDLPPAPPMPRRLTAPPADPLLLKLDELIAEQRKTNELLAKLYSLGRLHSEITLDSCARATAG